MKNANLSEFREFVKENTKMVVPYEYPAVLEWDKEGTITDILIKERSSPDVEGNLFKCVLCCDSFQYFNEFLTHMKEDFAIFLNKKGDENKN